MLYILALIIISFSAIVIIAGNAFKSPPPSGSPPDRYVSVKGSKIRYRDFGTGEPTLLLLHGFGDSLEEWKKIVPMFPANRVIALDLLGFGGSDRPALSYDLETQRLYLQAFSKKLKLNQTVLVGRSMGASLAAWTAARSDKQTVGLILIAPSAYPNSLTYPWPLSWNSNPDSGTFLPLFVLKIGCFEKFFLTVWHRRV